MAKKIEKQPEDAAKEPKKKTVRKATPKKIKEISAVDNIKEAKPLEAAKPVKKERLAEPIKSKGIDRGALLLGLGLLCMGAILLAGELIGFRFGDFLWPFIFIIPGFLVFIASLSTKSSSGEGLAILGGILTTLGLMFLVQSVFDVWASWAYAWALLAPTSIGFSQIIYGSSKGQDSIVKTGRRLVNIGLTIFVIGFIFFELVLNISGISLPFGLPTIPVALILIGLFILIRAIFSKR